MEFITPKQLDMLSAALRHVADASHILPASPDQAFHLAGLAHECALKATLGDMKLNAAIGHPGDLAEAQATDCALALDPFAARYRVAPRGTALARWRIDCRYDRTGKWAKEGTAALREAEETFGAVAAALVADGRVPGDFTW